ncbi:MAG: hemolysin family protein [Armatimonadetes bacterium]|nr:hemolysin family protein [Armatimonadota bacterium]
MDVNQLLKIFIALFLVALNGFFVAAEFAIVKVRKTRIQELAEEGGFFARTAHRAVQHLDAYLSATQLGITLASLGLGWIGEPAFAHLIQPLFDGWGAMGTAAAHTTAVAIAFLIITFLHIVFGELAPKSYAIIRPEGTTLALAWPLHLFYLVFYPAIWFLNGVANGVLRLIGLRSANEHEHLHTEEELRMILAESARGGSLRDSEALLVEQAFEFADTPVHAVMVPRVDVDFLSLDWTQARILEEIDKHPHTRYLVVEDEDLDQPRGFVHLKEMVSQLASTGIDLTKVLRPIHIVPETQSIERLLRELQARHSQIALVMDEYGGTAGIVTMEDLVEELIGEITDEMDEEPPDFLRRENVIVIQGAAALSDVSRELKEEIQSEHFDTLGGWIMGRLERVPGEGDSVESDLYSFTVTRMDGPRIVEIEAILKSEDGAVEPGGTAPSPKTDGDEDLPSF